MSGIVEQRVLETRKGFDMERWKQLYHNPPTKLKPPGNTEFFVDKDCFRKYLQYTYDMLFKTLDVFGLFGGIEGSGKTTDASQVGYQFWWIFKETNILREDLGTYYEWSEENCLAHNLDKFMDLCDKYNDEIFRIIICDEAGDLKGEDRWEENNKLFREDMRKDRKKLRVRLMCYPQPWELVKDFTLARVNFVRINRFSNDKSGYGSNPDVVDMVVIPRGNYTYSFHTRELVRRSELKKQLMEINKERYTSELPLKYIYKTTKKDDVFCFDAAKYIKKAKEENRTRKRDKKIYLSDRMVHIFANNLTAGKIGLSTKVDKNASKEEREQQEKEKKDALLVSKLVNTCREHEKKQKKES